MAMGSSCTVKAFLSTGFDLNNIPESPALLNSAASSVITLDAINCLPLDGRDNGKIKVKAFAQLPQVDYMSLYFPLDGVTFYVTDIRYEYVGLDTVEISFVVDAWLTAGGLSNISSISGITKRVHVPKSSDTFGAYTEEDEMICPSKPLEIDTGVTAEHYNYRTDQVDGGVTIVEATVDLAKMGEAYNDFGGQTLDAKYFEDDAAVQAGEAAAVTVPMIPTISDKSTVTIPYPGHEQSQEIIDMPAVAFFLASSTKSSTDGQTGTVLANKKIVADGIKAARCVAADSAVLAQYVIPSGYTDTANDDDVIGKLLILKGTYKETDTAPAPAYSPSGYTVRNKKLYTGTCNSYVIQAIASGNSATFKPEDIAETANETPTIFMFTDPRPNGKPYFRFKKFLKSTATWFTNLVAGIEWQNAPITYTDASGVALAERKLRSHEITDRGMLNLQQEYAKKMAVSNAVQSATGGGIGSAGAMSTGFYQNTGDVGKGDNLKITDSSGFNQSYGGLSLNPVGWIKGAVDGLYGGQRAEYGNDLAETQYNVNRMKERADFAVDNYVVAPTLAFPMNPSLRDVLGNGCYVYKYRLSDSDVIKCDRLLTMFGYRLTAPLEKSHFTNRPQFNYVEAASVKIEYTNPVSKRIRELAQSQINAGVRVWHVKPVNLLTANNE